MTKPVKKKKQKQITPKNLFKLESLNTPDLALNCDPTHLDKEVALLEKKIKLMPKDREGKIKYSIKEMESLITRLNNRYLYDDYKEFFEQYPYTQSARIKEVVASYSNLRTNRVEDFVPDMPEEAINAMHEYSKMTEEICGKKAVFYIIADHKDFEQQIAKRDPVLLAQSPFGLVWQIIGAWDEEMVLLEEL